MAAAANLDLIKVPFLRRGWAASHQIWYAGAEWQREVKIKRDQNYNFWRNKMAAGAILDFEKNSHNFGQDWGIWLKFCILVQNDT